MNVGTKSLRDRACASTSLTAAPGAKRVFAVQKDVTARLASTLKVSKIQASGLVRTVVAQTFAEASQHCGIRAGRLLEGTDAQFQANEATLALGSCTGASGGGAGGARPHGPGAGAQTCLQAMKDAMHPADECVGNPLASIGAGSPPGSCAGHVCFESSKDKNGNEHIYLAVENQTHQDANGDGIADVRITQLTVECKGECELSVADDGELVIENGTGVIMESVDLDGDGVADEFESSQPYPADDIDLGGDGGDDGGGDDEKEGMCAAFRVNRKVSFGYRLSGGDGGSKIQSGLIDLASSFGTCTCQAGLASLAGNVVSGGLVDGVALIRSAMCPTDEDRTRHGCAVNPLGPNDAPRKECLDLAKKDAAAQLAERKKALQCLNVQCNPAEEMAVFGTGKESSACGCMKVDAAVRVMNRGCMAMNCGDSQMCAPGGTLGVPATCGPAGASLRFELALP
jgi:hypothetical protein